MAALQRIPNNLFLGSAPTLFLTQKVTNNLVQNHREMLAFQSLRVLGFQAAVHVSNAFFLLGPFSYIKYLKVAGRLIELIAIIN